MRRTERWTAGSSMLATLVLATAAHAEPPPLIPVQGYLTDPDGAPIEGDHRLNFALYDRDRGGSELFNDAYPSIELVEGRFVVYLGSQEQPLDLALFQQQGELWLEITIDGEEVISPRAQLATVPYAAHANTCGDAATIDGRTGDDLDETFLSQSRISNAQADTLTGGGNADALHTHAAVPSSWFECGVISDLELCEMPDYPVDRFEYGIKYNGAEVRPALCTTWNSNYGFRLYNRDPYMIESDNPSSGAMRWGGTMWFTGTGSADDDQPTPCAAGAWRHRYWFQNFTDGTIDLTSSNGCTSVLPIWCRERT